MTPEQKARRQAAIVALVGLMAFIYLAGRFKGWWG